MSEDSSLRVDCVARNLEVIILYTAMYTQVPPIRPICIRVPIVTGLRSRPGFRQQSCATVARHLAGCNRCRPVPVRAIEDSFYHLGAEPEIVDCTGD